ncbi:MAG: hypothetical protein EB072_06610 [Betaproteobacteria bacterium]|nr:hypothetical protein [Betaproteobacteria bacterium]
MSAVETVSPAALEACKLGRRIAADAIKKMIAGENPNGLQIAVDALTEDQQEHWPEILGSFIFELMEQVYHRELILRGVYSPAYGGSHNARN